MIRDDTIAVESAMEEEEDDAESLNRVVETSVVDVVFDLVADVIVFDHQR